MQITFAVSTGRVIRKIHPRNVYSLVALIVQVLPNIIFQVLGSGRVKQIRKLMLISYA